MWPFTLCEGLGGARVPVPPQCLGCWLHHGPAQGPADSGHSVNGVIRTPWTGEPHVPNYIPSGPACSFFRGTVASTS